MTHDLNNQITIFLKIDLLYLIYDLKPNNSLKKYKKIIRKEKADKKEKKKIIVKRKRGQRGKEKLGNKEYEKIGEIKVFLKN